MANLGFKNEFVPAILSGEKKNTVRKEWAKPIQVGDKLNFFTGWRTDKCSKFHETICTGIDKIEIYTEKFTGVLPPQELIDYIPPTPELKQEVDRLIESMEKTCKAERWMLRIVINGKALDVDEMEKFAKEDGFHWVLDFAQFFNSHYGNEFKGVIIRW